MKPGLLMLPSAVSDSRVHNILPNKIETDFQFSRASSATRVNHQGLIENVGYFSDELVQNGDFSELGSELITNGDFSNGTTGWTANSCTLSVVDNTLKVTSTAGFGNAEQNITVVSGKTYKVSAAFIYGGSVEGRLNAYDGSASPIEVAASNDTSLSFYITISAGQTNLRIRAVNQSSSTGVYNNWDNVSVKEVDVNTARIDYTTEIGKAKELQKPSLLLEPQATNLVTFSNNFNQWSVAGTITRTYNYGISPDGTINSTRVVFSGVNEQIYIDFTSTSGVTGSIYIKGESGKTIKFGLSGAESLLTLNGEWQRITKYISGSTSRITLNTYSGATARDIEVFGGQAEQQTYATSYIPTSGSTVTRNQDLANNAGQLGVFNNEEGVLYAEMASLANSGVQRKLSISDGTNQKVVVLQFTNVNNQLRAFLYNGALQVNMYNVLSKALEFNKIAFKFKQDDFSLYVNGSEVATDPSGTTFSTGDLTQFNFNDGGISDPFHARIREIKVFRRALTDSELQELTNNIV